MHYATYTPCTTHNLSLGTTYPKIKTHTHTYKHNIHHAPCTIHPMHHTQFVFWVLPTQKISHTHQAPKHVFPLNNKGTINQTNQMLDVCITITPFFFASTTHTATSEEMRLHKHENVFPFRSFFSFFLPKLYIKKTFPSITKLYSLQT